MYSGASNLKSLKLIDQRSCAYRSKSSGLTSNSSRTLRLVKPSASSWLVGSVTVFCSCFFVDGDAGGAGLAQSFPLVVGLQLFSTVLVSSAKPASRVPAPSSGARRAWLWSNFASSGSCSGRASGRGDRRRRFVGGHHAAERKRNDAESQKQHRQKTHAHVAVLQPRIGKHAIAAQTPLRPAPCAQHSLTTLIQDKTLARFLTCQFHFEIGGIFSPQSHKGHKASRKKLYVLYVPSCPFCPLCQPSTPKRR